ncbi:ABC-type transporter, periplasmic subunit family 3 [Clostridium sp. DL-VIII]|uniref:substrate-binding periplasmic protein n=1 Tax=Clostridium sp. DL-VIII TaxID=641107 RepID=UPI00023AF9B2|nr:ABC transporter substrate-binding protein [Clostridium sp. DL-VIII]EHI98727.1 ABC-type transporter, periplasmic subunit family 3 [Clostridium sp. DL-VIII]
MKKKILAVLMLGVMTLSFMGCGSSGSDSASKPADAQKASTTDLEGSMKDVSIKIGTSGLFGPFSYYDKDGKTLIGYDIDLINDIQKILGFKIDGGGLQAMDYSALTTSIAEGKLDVGAAALCATDERKAVMKFSDTYCDSGQKVMINKNNDEGITGVDSLAGKTVAVEKGTASHIYAQKNLTNSKIEVHDTITTAYESLEQKKVDAVIQDAPGCAFYIKTTNGTALETVGDEFNNGQAPYAIAYNNNFKYKDKFDAALAKLKEDGTLDKLYDKWCK